MQCKGLKADPIEERYGLLRYSEVGLSNSILINPMLGMYPVCECIPCLGLDSRDSDPSYYNGSIGETFSNTFLSNSF